MGEHATPLCLHLNCHGDDSISSEDHLQLFTERKQLLATVEDVLWRILNRSEARLWLCKDIASMISVPSRTLPSLFLVNRPTSKSQRISGDVSDELLCKQTLRLACSQQPRRVMRLFNGDSRFIRHFFSGNTKRILGWFEKFTSSYKIEKSQFGSQALIQFAFVHRDRYWKELEWKGSHGQAPAIVASKPHYFLDLDVLRTVENFLDYVPEFWSSDELWESLKGGEIISLDMDYFVEKLFDRMDHGSSDVWYMLEDFLHDQNFSHLCQNLLPFFNDEKLLVFVDNISKIVSEIESTDDRHSKEIVSKNGWLVEVFKTGSVCPSLDCAMLCNASINHSRQLLRFLHDEDNIDEFERLKRILPDLKVLKSMCGRKHWPLVRESLKFNKWETVKWLALQFLSILVLISEEYSTDRALKSILSENSIKYRHSSEDRKLKTKKDRKERKKKKKKKRRRKHDDWSDTDSFDSSQSDLDEDHCGRIACEMWYTSIDDFKTGMEKGELPEQLSYYGFGHWLHWASEHWCCEE